MKLAPLLLLSLVATGAAAPDITSIIATNSSALIIFTEPVNGTGYWQLSYSGSPVAANTVTLGPPAVAQASVTYPTQTAAGNYSFLYSLTVGYGTNFSTVATLSKTSTFSLLPPPTPAPTATPNPYKINIVSPTGGLVISDSLNIAGTVGGAIPAAVQVAPAYSSIVQGCDQTSGYQNATLIGGGWAWYWAVREKTYRQGDYVLYARAVDGGLNTVACASVQVSIGTNTSAAAAAVATAAESASGVKLYTCLRSGKRALCSCDTIKLNDEVTVIFPASGKLTVKLQGAAQKVSENLNNDAVPFTPKKAGTYQFFFNDKKIEECDIGDSSSALTGGYSTAPYYSQTTQRCGVMLPPTVADEISAGACYPIADCANLLPQFAGLAGISQGFKLDVGEKFTCSGFSAPLYYRIANLQSGIEFYDSSMPVLGYPQGIKQQAFNFSPQREGVYEVTVKKEMSDPWTRIAIYQPVYGRNDALLPLAALFVVLGSARFMRRQTLRTNVYRSGNSGPTVWFKYTYMKRIISARVGAHSNRLVECMDERGFFSLRKKSRHVTFGGGTNKEELWRGNYLYSSGELFKGTLWEIRTVEGRPLLHSFDPSAIPPTHFYAEKQDDMNKLRSDYVELLNQRSQPPPLRERGFLARKDKAAAERFRPPSE